MQELIEKIEDLKESIATVLLEVDHITLQVNPRILLDYSVKIGCWENELLDKQIAARRARRKCELAQAAANRGKEVDDLSLELALEVEFTEWQNVLANARASFEADLKRRLSRKPMSPAESKEFRQLHRTLVKRLHPDMNGGRDERAVTLFSLAQRAFEQGDLAALRSLEVATTSYEQSAEDALAGMAESELLLEIDLLEAQLGFNEKKLASLKASNPYTLLPLLEDEKWVEDTIAALKNLIEGQVAVREDYERRYAALVEQLSAQAEAEAPAPADAESESEGAKHDG